VITNHLTPGINPVSRLFGHCLLSVVLFSTSYFVSAQTAQQSSTVDAIPESVVAEDDGTGVVTYPAGYFERFRPNTALDMVRQIPGFQLRDNTGDTTRGFGSAVGNLFINDRRPTAKQDSLPAILARIPALTVERIELIRSQIRSIDLRGQSSVINIILREDIPAAYQWEAAFRQTFGHGPLKPEAAVSISDVWRGIEFNAGIDARPSSVGRNGEDDIIDNNNILIEKRFENRENRNLVIKPSLTASSWIGEMLFQFNANYTFENRDIYTYSERVPQVSAGSSREVFVDDNKRVSAAEAGIDIERELTSDLTGKAIFLYLSRGNDTRSIQRNINSDGIRTLLRDADAITKTTEVISRVEFDWSRLENHLIQANLERASNILDGSLIQIDDTGSGPLEVNVPGANSRVEETRWDFLLKDTWLAGKYEFDYGLGAEASTITQSGDAEQKRSFFFVKPQAAVSYTSAEGSKTRLRYAREIAQLDLNGFISSTVFEDDDLALGNPDLQPDSTWKLEISHDRRFSSNSAVRITAFHHWIEDVLDLLPLTSNFEAPGNIGDGRRWGIQLEGTIPLDWIQLVGAKLNLKARWQDSAVIDPVTGKNRVLSVGTVSTGPIIFNVENKFGYELDFRQDFQGQRIAWGWLVKERAKQYQFKVNELEIYDEDMDIHIFIETTRWFGIKMQLIAENILNFQNYRNRTIYAAERELSALQSRELRVQTRGERLQLVINGSF
jgi:hypothetical protein